MIGGYNWRKKEYWDELRWLAWHSALLPYLRKVPALKEFMTEQQKSQGNPQQSLQEMKATMKAFANAMNKGR